MKTIVISTRRPADVAREVEERSRRGERMFVVRRLAHGGMLDQERLGAARYAAGPLSTVELEDEPAAVAAER